MAGKFAPSTGVFIFARVKDQVKFRRMSMRDFLLYVSMVEPLAAWSLNRVAFWEYFFRSYIDCCIRARQVFQFVITVPLLETSTSYVSTG